jgi:hypothetical protein
MKGAIVLLAIAALVAGIAFGQAPAPSVPLNVTVCALIATPDAFRNKRVEVVGTIISGIEVSALTDEHCVNDKKFAPMIWLTTDAQRIVRYSPGWTSKAFVTAKRAAPITGASANVTWVEPLPVPRTPESQVDALHTAIRQSEGREVRVVVVGRFDSSTGGLLVQATDGHVRWSPGFGHLGGYASQIVIESFRLVGGE